MSVSFAPGSVLAPGADLTGKHFVSWIAAFAAVALVVNDHSLSCVPKNQAVAALDLARTYTLLLGTLRNTIELAGQHLTSSLSSRQGGSGNPRMRRFST